MVKGFQNSVKFEYNLLDLKIFQFLMLDKLMVLMFPMHNLHLCVLGDDYR